MNVKVLAWYEKATKGVMYTWMDRFIRYHDCEMRLIDTLGQFLPRETNRLPVAYATLQEAMEDMSDHQWVFMDPNGPVVLDEYTHPSGSLVVYAFGSNLTGFGQDVSGHGDLVRLRKEDQIFAEHAIPYVLYDRTLFFQGRRSP